VVQDEHAFLLRAFHVAKGGSEVWDSNAEVEVTGGGDKTRQNVSGVKNLVRGRKSLKENSGLGRYLTWADPSSRGTIKKGGG